MHPNRISQNRKSIQNFYSPKNRFKKKALQVAVIVLVPKTVKVITVHKKGRPPL